MIARPRLLDLFCGAGGAAMGYQRAGFYVVGVDIKPQPHYCGDEFHQADALEYPLDGFDAIHASPPCQGYSRMRHLPWLAQKEYPLLIEPVRERLASIGIPYVIENVEDAPLERESSLIGPHGILLCGTMFDLPIYRHRPFESNVLLIQPEHPRHVRVITPRRFLKGRGRITTWQQEGGVGGHMGNVDRVRQAMDIDWMTAAEISQAIPPAYTEWIGVQLRNHLEQEGFSLQDQRLRPTGSQS